MLLVSQKPSETSRLWKILEVYVQPGEMSLRFVVSLKNSDQHSNSVFQINPILMEWTKNTTPVIVTYISVTFIQYMLS